MFTQVWKAVSLLFHWKASEGVHEHPEPVCKFVCVCVCVFMPLLEEAEPYFSLGGGRSQNNTDSNNVKTSVETPGSSLSVPSQYPDFPSENL